MAHGKREDQNVPLERKRYSERPLDVRALVHLRDHSPARHVLFLDLILPYRPFLYSLDEEENLEGLRRYRWRREFDKPCKFWVGIRKGSFGSVMVEELRAVPAWVVYCPSARGIVPWSLRVDYELPVAVVRFREYVIGFIVGEVFRDLI